MKTRHDVVIVGAGQAGLATSYFLTRSGIDHIVLERGEIANAWIRDRWDTFCLVTPNWTITLPGATYEGPDPDGFMLRDDFVTCMRNWACSFGSPVEAGVEVSRISGEPGDFRLDTSRGPIEARIVVVATATYQKPRAVPLMDRFTSRLHQLQATEYRNPGTLPDGAVMVIGSGQTGCQLAEELREAGRDVYLSVGHAGRLPRRYRGHDCLYWQREMGWLDRTPDFLEKPELRFRGDPHVSGKNGGHTISLHKFRVDGIRLLGHLSGADEEILHFADDLSAGLQFADDYARSFYQAVDDHIALSGTEAPRPSAMEVAGGPGCETLRISSPRSLDLKREGVTSVIWATGFTYDFSWIDFSVLDAMGYPVTDRGTTSTAGLYFMGLNWMTKRKSGIIYGVAEDARHVSAHIADRLGHTVPAQPTGTIGC